MYADHHCEFVFIIDDEQTDEFVCELINCLTAHRLSCTKLSCFQKKVVLGISLDQNEMDTIAEYWGLLKLTEKSDKITGKPRLEMFSPDDPTAYKAGALSTQFFDRN